MLNMDCVTGISNCKRSYRRYPREEAKVREFVVKDGTGGKTGGVWSCRDCSVNGTGDGSKVKQNVVSALAQEIVKVVRR